MSAFKNMPRETKYRAWDKENKKMFFVRELYWDENFQVLKADGLIVDKQIELMQYISLEDKNGKEIYDGDIIIFSDSKDEPRQIIFGNNDGWHPYNLFNENWWRDSEVIGNIYENKDLLK